MGGDGYVSLFETKEAMGQMAYRFFSISMFLGVCLIWVYRATYFPKEAVMKRWIWFGMFGAELWFGFYWTLTQSVRWKRVYRYTFKDRLSLRYEDELPAVDIFVCTADPTIEPPMLVINTILSLMAYDYPSHKLAIYLSDDGGSDLTFYALLEASHFAKHWIPFCKKFKVDPRAPVVYFSQGSEPRHSDHFYEEWSTVKNLYEEMKSRIEQVVEQGHISEEIRVKHKGFSEWNSVLSSQNHQTILQILIGGRDPNASDDEGCALPTLMYLAREKRPRYHHNFKAGAQNALVRVSSEISNAPIILTMDCDMYSNCAETVRDAMCFFMDEEKGQEIGFVQYPQRFMNITKNDIYATSFKALTKVELPGLDAYGGPPYIGTGCFFRRETVCGKKYSKDCNRKWKTWLQRHEIETIEDLEERAMGLASCRYEQGTQWGKEMGVTYANLVEDVTTSLLIHCKGWKSVFSDPAKDAFLGMAPSTLLSSLVQHKRCMEGLLHIFLSHHCPFIQGHGKIKLPLQMSYSIYNLCALCSIPILYYVIFPPLCLLHGIALFPEIRSPWFIPFTYVITARYTCSLAENLWFGQTIQAWWNYERMWLYRRTSAYLFSIIDATLNFIGIAKSAFTITAKVTNDDVAKRYEKELMEFGVSSPMFTVLSTLAMVYALCLGGAIKKMTIGDGAGVVGPLTLQIVLCGLLVMINKPIYEAMFLRKDKGRVPPFLAFRSTTLAVLVCLMPIH